MKINKIKTQELKQLKDKLEAGNQSESQYYRHVSEEYARRTKIEDKK